MSDDALIAAILTSAEPAEPPAAQEEPVSVAVVTEVHSEPETPAEPDLASLTDVDGALDIALANPDDLVNQLVDEDDPNEPAPAPVEVDIAVCSNCNAAVFPEMEYCDECGAKVTRKEPEKPASPRQQVRPFCVSVECYD